MQVAVGRVAKAHGITGELAVDLHTDSPQLRFAVGATLTAKPRTGPTSTLTVAATRPHGERLLIRFDEVADRDSAEHMRGALLLADTDDLPATEDPDEFYDHQLAGLDVALTDGSVIGTVLDVLHGAGGDLLSVRLKDGDDALVPFVRQIVPTVDLANRRVVLDPPEGLFG